jgi:hypothetical protein
MLRNLEVDAQVALPSTEAVRRGVVVYAEFVVRGHSVETANLGKL